MANSKAGAVVHRAKEAEDRLVREIDEKNRGRLLSFGEERARIVGFDIVTNLTGAGFRFSHIKHPKTRAKWLAS